MDLPSLPTDNLYKFMALGGLAGVLLIPTYYLSQWTEAERQGIETYTTMRSLKAETEFVTEDMNNLERDVAREGKTTRKIAVDVKVLEREVAEAGRRPALSRSRAEELEGKRGALRDRLDHLSEAHREEERALARLRKQSLRLTRLQYEVEGKRQLLTSLTHTLTAFQWAFWVLLNLSWLATVLGFTLWYRRVQRYQDQLVRAQSGSREHG